MFSQQETPSQGTERTTAALEGILRELGSIRVQLAELTKTARRPRSQQPLGPPAAPRRR